MKAQGGSESHPFIKNPWTDLQFVKPYVRWLTWAWLAADIVLGIIVACLVPRSISLLGVGAILGGISGGGFAAIILSPSQNPLAALPSRLSDTWSGWVLTVVIASAWIFLVLLLVGVK